MGVDCCVSDHLAGQADQGAAAGTAGYAAAADDIPLPEQEGRRRDLQGKQNKNYTTSLDRDVDEFRSPHGSVFCVTHCAVDSTQNSAKL